MNQNVKTVLEKRALVIAALVTTGVLVGGGSSYLSQRSALAVTRNQLEQLQKNLGEVRQELNTKNKEIETLKKSATAKEEELNKKLAEVQHLQDNIQTVGECLAGIVVAMDAASKNDETTAFLGLMSVTEPCKKADVILSNIQRVKKVHY